MLLSLKEKKMQNKNLLYVLVVAISTMLIVGLSIIITGQEFNAATRSVSAVAGLLMGLLYWYLIRLLERRKEQQLQVLTLDLDDKESLIMEGMAKQWLHREGILGKLYLTSRRLIFRSAKSTHDPIQFAISLDKISNIKVDKSIGVLDIGIILKTSIGEKRLLIDFPGDWRSLIEWQKILLKAGHE